MLVVLHLTLPLLPRHVSVCEALVHHGATVNAEDDDRRTPLFYAVQQVDDTHSIGQYFALADLFPGPC